MADLLSVKGEGYMYTGGAHGLPLYSTFFYDLQQDRLLPLSELLSDSTALVPISGNVRRSLEDRLIAGMAVPDDEETAARAQARERIDEGAAPELDNYALYLVETGSERAGALTFLFPPYQVAPYAAGLREATVPASMLEEALRPVYRERFDVPLSVSPQAGQDSSDPEAQKGTNGQADRAGEHGR